MSRNLIGAVMIFAVAGAFLGAAAGYRFFTTVPPKYTARSLVQVVRIPILDGEEQRPPSNVPSDEQSMIIRSQRVLREAVKNGRLSNYEEFSGMKPNEIIQELMGTNNLIIERVDKGGSTALLNLSYTSGDAELSANGLNSIVDSYKSFCETDVKSGFMVKILNQPSIGFFTGPMLLPYMLAGALGGFFLGAFPAFLLVLILSLFSKRTDTSHRVAA